MTTKHTEGPWKVVGLEAIYNDKGQEVASVRAVNREVDDVDDYEMQANARLIAAAPELLKQCEIQLDWLEHVKDEVKCSDSIKIGFNQSIKYLNQVISKAKGEV